MSSLANYIRKPKKGEIFQGFNTQQMLNQEYFTGEYHPYNHKPIYRRVLVDNMSNHDGNDTWINTGFSGIDLCWVEDFWLVSESEYASDGLQANTKTNTYIIDDASEFRIWCRKDGTQYRKAMPNSISYIQNKPLYIYFEYTKSGDVAAY